MVNRRSCTDDDLRLAIAAARSWRGVLRHLGLHATSSSAIRSVRRHADRLSLDHAHFTGQRRWTEHELAEAVRSSRSWSEVSRALGLTGGSSETALKGHAVRLGIAAHHFRATLPTRPPGLGVGDVDLRHLPRDLLVRMDARFERIQVKTTTLRRRRSWLVSISNTRKGRVVYAPGEIDQFFVIVGQLNYYLIPYAAVGGLQGLSLSAYDEDRVHSGG